MSVARRLVLLGVALALAATGCSDGSDDEPSSSPAPSPSASPLASASPTATAVTAADLEGTSYASTDVTGHDLVEGTVILLAFELGNLSVSAGCNTMFGPYDVGADGSLRWTGEPAATLKACSEGLTAQDDWLASLFTEGVVATTGDAALTLTSGEVTIVFTVETETTDLSSLLGHTWTVVGTIADGATQRTPRRNRLPRLEVGRDGLSRLDTGCNSGRTVVRVDGDDLVFGPTTTTRQRCPQPGREIERRVLAVLDGRTDSVETNGKTLIVTKDQVGLVIQVR